ncbi:efflux RND transporter periplasmic adaptor subunit [Vibrio metschnikovii]|nr:efflux RND transporter periplasmic adaptor subunit [Vibrio metschnikovii]
MTFNTKPTLSGRKSLSWLNIAGMLSAVLMLSACGGETSEEKSAAAAPAMPVTIAEVTTQAATYQVQYPARVRGAREVEVRAQVSGILQQRHFEEGSFVEKGHTLFQLDPEPFQLALDTATAEHDEATANQLQAQREWDRVAELFRENAVSTREYDQAQALFAAANARLTRAGSALSDAKRNLRYTRVEAPISGVVKVETVSEGNLIAQGAILTELVQIDPVQVHFAIPQTDMLRYRDNTIEQRAAVENIQFISEQGAAFAIKGTLNYQAPSVDPATGRVLLRAIVNNADNNMLPGQFVRVALNLQHFEQAILVEPSAISQGAEGPQVFVVNNSNQAEAKKVTLGPVIDGKQVVLTGLQAGDKLVVNGQVALRNGVAVQITNG